MGVHWALPLLQSLLPDEIWQRTNTAQPDPHLVAKDTDTFAIHNGQTGELLKNLPSGGMRRFSRTRLRTLISEGIDVKYGKTLTSISYDDSGGRVSAHFADGTNFRGDILIGADGPRSKVREVIVGKEKSEATASGVVMGRVRTKYKPDQALVLRHHASIASVAIHPNGTYTGIFGQDFTSPQPQDWEFQVTHSSMPIDFKESNAEKLKLLKSRAVEYVGIWKDAIDWIPDGTALSFNRLVYWKPIEFDNKQGRATLAGDAAHPMTPQRGQGLNHAICDAAKLVAALAMTRKRELSLSQAVSEYDSEMIKRGGDEVKESLVNTHMFHDWTAFSQSPIMRKSVAKG